MSAARAGGTEAGPARRGCGLPGSGPGPTPPSLALHPLSRGAAAFVGGSEHGAGTRTDPPPPGTEGCGGPARPPSDPGPSWPCPTDHNKPSVRAVGGRRAEGGGQRAGGAHWGWAGAAPRLGIPAVPAAPAVGNSEPRPGCLEFATRLDGRLCLESPQGLAWAATSEGKGRGCTENTTSAKPAWSSPPAAPLPCSPPCPAAPTPAAGPGCPPTHSS